MANSRIVKFVYVKWWRRYWIFFVIAVIILIIQGLLAYSFYSVYTGNDDENFAFKGNTGRSRGNVQLTHQKSQQSNLYHDTLVNQFIEDYNTDDEDSPSNLFDRPPKDSSSRNNYNNKESGGSDRQRYLAQIVVPNNYNSKRNRKGAQANKLSNNNPSSSSLSDSVLPSSSSNANNKSVTVELLKLDELEFKPTCNISTKEAISAIHRATTQKCKQQIANVTCLIQNNLLYPTRLPRLCPTDDGSAGHYLGCYSDDAKRRLLPGAFTRLKDNSPSRCLDVCLRSGFQYAGVQFKNECFCGKVKPSSGFKQEDSKCHHACPKDPNLNCGGYLAMNVYSTGLPKFVKKELLMPPNWEYPRHVRIVFLLTVNGRALRQVKRLLKALYHKQHYFYIHIDSRQDFLYRELLPLETQLQNVRLSRWRLSTIWGGASLLQMLLKCISDLLEIPGWEWDYVINLSESDFPIKSLERLEMFLTANMGMNFVKSHGQDTQRFIAKQGLDKSFYECDTHMWRLGDRSLPWGIRMDGGSDWLALNRNFCAYVSSKEPDKLLQGLKIVFQYTLLPAESFFHTVLQNSAFCEQIVDNNLHVTNWKRKQGCKCQYKHIVDWCGCSPNDFKSEDWPRIQSTEDRPFFFGRKFEPSISQSIIEQVERWTLGPRLQHNVQAIGSYWQNQYHYLDSSPKPDDAQLTLFGSLARLGILQLEQATDGIVDSNCKPRFESVREATLYFQDDNYKGTLVLYEAKLKGVGQTVRLETQLRPINRFTVQESNGFMGKLTFLQVGSDFDQKEQLFRNFGRILGPFTELGAMHKWDSVKQTFAVTFVWVDPAGTVAGSYEVKVEAASPVLYHKPTFRTPLRPGIWSLLLMHEWALAAETQFLVVPLSIHNGQEVLQDQVRFLHSGPGQPYVDHDFSQVESLLASLGKINGSHLDQRRLALESSRLEGQALRDWIDKLVSQYWSTQSTCFVSQPAHPTGGALCPQLDLEPCQQTEWSSKASDPKSEIGNVDKQTGKLL